MVTVINKRDIGQEMGSGFAQTVQQGMQRLSERSMDQSMIANAMSNADAEIKAMEEQAKASGRNLTTTDYTTALMKHLAAHPGIREMIPQLSQYAFNQGRYNARAQRGNAGGQLQGASDQVGGQLAPNAVTQPQVNADGQFIQGNADQAPQLQPIQSDYYERGLRGDRLSPQEFAAFINQRAYEYGQPRNLDEGEAKKYVLQEYADLNRVRTEQQDRANETWQQFVSDDFTGPEGIDIDPVVLSAFKERYDKLLGRMGEQNAWNIIRPDMVAVQKEFQNVRLDPGRTLLFSNVDDAIKQARNLLRNTIQIAPEIARSLMIEEFGLGEAEASEAIRPGSKEWKNFKKVGEDQRKKLEAVESAGYLGKKALEKGSKTMSPKVIIDKSEKAIRQYLKNGFDPERDSLLALKGLAHDMGIDPSRLGDIIEDIFPEGKGLSDFNKREMVDLAVIRNPSMSQVFQGMLTDFWKMPWQKIQSKLGKR